MKRREIIKRIGIVIAFPFIFVHEGCHYLVGRAVGLNPRIDWWNSQTDYDDIDNYDWRFFSFILAPSLFGLVATALLLRYHLAHRNSYEIAETAMVGLFWQAACLSDFQAAWQGLKDMR